MVKSKVFILPLLIWVLFFHNDRIHFSFDDLNGTSQLLKSVEPQDSTQNKAFAVLDSKCNFCHITRNRLDHFTMDNMNGLIPKINEQVFAKNKMPKGKNNVLTIEEKNSLLIWINRESQN